MVFEGPPAELAEFEDSLTGQHLVRRAASPSRRLLRNRLKDVSAAEFHAP